MKKLFTMLLFMAASLVVHAQCPPSASSTIFAYWNSTTHDFNAADSPYRVPYVAGSTSYKILAQTGNSAFNYTFKIEDPAAYDGGVGVYTFGFVPMGPGAVYTEVTTNHGTIFWNPNGIPGDPIDPVHQFLSFNADNLSTPKRTFTISSNPYSDRNLVLAVSANAINVWKLNCRPQPYLFDLWGGSPNAKISDPQAGPGYMQAPYLEITIPPSGKIYMVDEVEYVVPGMQVVDLQYGLNNNTTWYNYDPTVGIPAQSAGATIRFRARYRRNGNTDSYKVQIVTPWGTHTGSQIPSSTFQTYVPTAWFTVTSGATYGDIFLRRTNVIP